MDRDGTTDGYEPELTRAGRADGYVRVIASARVSFSQHLVEAVVEGGADGARRIDLLPDVLGGRTKRARGARRNMVVRDAGATS